jgi:hypothetical protein
LTNQHPSAVMAEDLRHGTVLTQLTYDNSEGNNKPHITIPQLIVDTVDIGRRTLVARTVLLGPTDTYSFDQLGLRVNRRDERSWNYQMFYIAIARNIMKAHGVIMEGPELELRPRGANTMPMIKLISGKQHLTPAMLHPRAGIA